MYIAKDIFKKKHYVIEIFFHEDKTKRQWNFVQLFYPVWFIFFFKFLFGIPPSEIELT